ncbi:histidine kinase [Georgenia phoenicis]|uniref:histidine kinase n=1 Tax=unclassified Georgenia TaxID=2626815 RepID=UPI0039AEB955
MQQWVATWRARVRGTERARIVSDAGATFALGLVLLAAGLVDMWQNDAPTDRWWYLLTLTAACLVMLGKGRRPLLALAAGLGVFVVDAALGGSTGVLVALLDLIYSAALRASATAVRRMVMAATVSIAGTAAVAIIATGDLQTAVYAAMLVFAVLGTPLWWGRSVRQQTELAELASARARDLARIGELREHEVLHAERTRMAGDLHDALASHLSAIAIHSEAALSAPRPPEDGAARDRQALAAIRDSSVAALREMRSMIDLLRTGDEPRTSPARLAELDTLVAGFRGDGMELRTTCPDDLPPLPAAVDQAGYRIVQEALTNALKHGDGGPVDVVVALDDGALRVEVANATTTTPGAARAGVGLLTMRERSEALGGSFAAGRDGDRWRVRATIPVEEP